MVNVDVTNIFCLNDACSISHFKNLYEIKIHATGGLIK